MPNATMKPTEVSPESSQAAQPVARATKKQPKKLKVRHLSELTKRIIVERYVSLLDFNEVAVAMELPGLTGNTVCNVVTAYMLSCRKPPTPELSLSSRRFAA